jgi:hypothetical protein
MAIDKVTSASITTDAVGPTQLNEASNYAFTGTVTGAGKEITEIDMWRLNNNFTGSGSSSYALINNYWERADSDGFVKKGTGLSESSGVFTFPSTGFWKIDWNFETVQNNDEYLRIKMMFGGSSGNNSTVNEDVSGANATGYASVSSSAIIKCTDVADKFTFYNSTSNGSIDGDSGSNRSGFTCIKINDV